MENYILRGSKANFDEICEFIYSNGGSVEYKSPILPIIGYTGNERLNSRLINKFSLSYLTAVPDNGVLLEEEGSLTSQFTPLQLIPKIDFAKFRKVGLTEWSKV